MKNTYLHWFILMGIMYSSLSFADRPGGFYEPYYYFNPCQFSNLQLTGGEHRVRWGPWASSIEDPAVFFCKNSELISEYKISDLIDDKDKLVRTVSHFTWKSTSKIDDKAGTLFIETVDNNHYVFDINTGNIIDYQYNPPPIFRADIEYKNGNRETITDLKSCGIMPTVTLFQEKGHPIHDLHVAAAVKRDNATEIVQTIGIPYKEIKSLNFLESINDNYSLWNITTHGADSMQVNVDAKNVNFCGKDGRGKDINVSASKINNLALSKMKSAEPRQGIRTIDQRMRWNRFESSSVRNHFCNNEIPDNYHKRLVDQRHVWEFLKELKWANCNADSRRISSTLSAIEAFATAGGISLSRIKIEIEIARFQGSIGQYQKAFSLYEDVLRRYNTLSRNNKYAHLSRKRELLTEMIDMSVQANAAEKTIEYKKLLTEVK